VPPTSRRSLWTDTLPPSERFEPTPTSADRALAGHDVAIVGGGYTGLWTAWYLAQRDPNLRILVLERDRIGFGASGRNGGWCSAILPMSLDTIADRHGASAAHRMQSAMHDTVREVGRFAAEHAPADVLQRSGTIDLARNEPQRRRLLDHLAEQRRFGFGDDDHRWLDAAETAEVVRATGAIGAITTPHCATVHPLRLVHALARAVAAAGVTIVEGVEVTEIHPGRLETDAGSIRVDVVVRATEGYTCDLPGERRSMLPIYSLMIATEPLPAEVWGEIGLDERPTFTDGRNLIVYGQRTADGRFAFGGRGAAYRFGSRISPDLDHDDRVRDLLVEELVAMFPMVRGTAITHHWGGVLGATRDWQCAVRFDRRAGFATAGGYVGDGVATTNLAGRTLAALIGGPSLDGDDELLRLPWVGHRSRRWEPEPLRWIGVNTARIAARRADRYEDEHDDSSRLWGGLMSALLRR
jgi:glycine/D-amino acid oxidase-like deaminating enzyme